MPRHAFRQDLPHAGRLLNVVRRPVENEKSAFVVLRLEFEIFHCDQVQRELRSDGQIASRDLMIGSGAADDGGVLRFARALGITEADSSAAWIACLRAETWVGIVFGSADEADSRHKFQKVRAFSPNERGYRIREFKFEMSKNWVTSGQAAKALDVSEATVRRHTRRHVAEYGPALERRTTGGARRINLNLLRHIIQDPGWLDEVRIAGGQRVRELEYENTKLRRENAELKQALTGRCHQPRE
jgi:transposase-like protein